MSGVSRTHLMPWPPTKDQVEHGTGYTSWIELNPPASGGIYNTSDPPEIVYRCSTEPSRNSFSLFNLLKKPDFVLVDEASRCTLRIRRKRRLPATFDIIDHETVVGVIQRKSVLRNKYLVRFSEGLEWTIRMPLFTIDFYGISSLSTNLWIRVWPGKNQWCLLLNGGEDDRRLLAAIAFIHREWWCYG